jgi:hypothetical protein
MYIVMEESEQSELNKLKFKNNINKFVHTRDGNILGKLESIDNDYFVIKKEVIQSLYYHIPLNRFKELDSHALWLDISERQAIKNYLQQIIKK